MKTLLLLSALLGLALPVTAEEETPKWPRDLKGPDAVRLFRADKATSGPNKRPPIVVLDVRTAEEFAAGHVPGAVNLDVTAPDFAEKAALLEKDRRYLVHCASGGRSRRAVPILQEQGISRIFHLTDGFAGWTEAGGPVEGGEASAPADAGSAKPR